MSAKHSKRACSEATSTLRARLAQAGDDDNAAVVEWLSSYETGTDICFHPTPAELTATVRLSFLKDIIRAFCVVRTGTPKLFLAHFDVTPYKHHRLIPVSV